MIGDRAGKTYTITEKINRLIPLIRGQTDVAEINKINDQELCTEDSEGNENAQTSACKNLNQNNLRQFTLECNPDSIYNTAFNKNTEHITISESQLFSILHWRSWRNLLDMYKQLCYVQIKCILRMVHALKNPCSLTKPNVLCLACVETVWQWVVQGSKLRLQ